MSQFIRSLSQQEQLNFLLTNRIPRNTLTRFMGWFSRIENPLIRNLSIAIWKRFADDLNLHEAKKTSFSSLHDCFIRQIKPEARPIDDRSSVATSPCDSIVGSCGLIQDSTVFQAKGFPYDLNDLMPDMRLQQQLKNGVYVTLRLKSSMYHRFHAPIDCHVNEVNYISGDTWNVNPIALKRVEKLFCKNERAVIRLNAAKPELSLVVVPVAAILVASMKFHCLQETLNIKYLGPNRLPCNVDYQKGEEMGYFQHGSTIILFAPQGYELCNGIEEGRRVFMGQPLLECPR